MTFLQKLRAINVRRCEEGFGHPLASWSGMEWGCAAAGEMGELCNLLKKQQRETQGIAGSRIQGNAREELGKEIADVVIYLDLLAAREGLQLEDIVRAKFNDTSQKINFIEVL